MPHQLDTSRKEMRAVPQKKGTYHGPIYSPQHPMRINLGPYRAEQSGMLTGDHYFSKQSDMLDFIQGKINSYTPMIWNDDRGIYEIDFDSADLLGQ